MSEDRALHAVMACASVALVIAVLLLVYMFGWFVGLWPMTCKLAHNQPQCIAQGWNGGTVHIK